MAPAGGPSAPPRADRNAEWEAMKKTPLFDVHAAAAGRMVNLKGFARPVEYAGHAEEHRAIRERVSLCDVSHMGELEFSGRDALALVNRLITNDASRLDVNQALYTVMCDEDGHVIDDLVCLRLAEDRFLWVVNVTRTDEDHRWALKHAQGLDAHVRDRSAELALLALQGPYSSEVLQKIAEADLSEMAYYRLAETTLMTDEAEVRCIVGRIGYTGERGYEICVSRDLAPYVWRALMRAGRPLGIAPHGVAARESARTEAGYLLNGNDMDDRTYPHEVGLGWVVKPHKDFIGREALAAVAERGTPRKLVGLEVEGRATIRHGYPVFRDGERIGRVTSGPLSPELLGGASSLGLGFVASAHARDGGVLQIGARGARLDARIVPYPFRKRRVRDDARVDTLSPYGLRYGEDHLWVGAVSGGRAAIGLTDFGQRHLGEALFFGPPAPGDRIVRGSPFGWLDAYRKPFDLIAPVSGTVVAVNASAVERPGDVNRYPYARDGLIRIEPDDAGEISALAGLAAYAEATRRLERYDSWSRELRTT